MWPETGAKSAEDWRRRALAFESAHDLPAALDAYQNALAVDPASLDIAHHLADLAFRLGQWDMAEKFYAHLITQGRQDLATVIAYAASLREQGRFSAAIDLFKTLLDQHPGESVLWEGLGTAVAATGDFETALTFFNEALRLDPGNMNAVFNRGCTLIETGDMVAGLEDVRRCAISFSDPNNRANAELTCAQMTLAMGNLSEGWRWYEGRHWRGTPREVMYDLKLTRRKDKQPIAGKRIFISAEQGLGDEVLFASLLPDLIAENGNGHIGIGVEPRLVILFQRSFPDCTVVAHRTQTRNGRIHRDFPDLDQSQFDIWALIGDFLGSHRAHIADFGGRQSFLTPDPERVAYWRTYFAALNDKPKVGIVWKSLKSSILRDRAFSPFGLWENALLTPGIQFINLQYGDTTEDLAMAKAAGIDLHTPEGIDLKQDLDDLAALTSALNVTMGPSNATSNIAAACGAPVWILSQHKPWLALGQAHYPWYPSARLFQAPAPGDWASAMADIRAALTLIKS